MAVSGYDGQTDRELAIGSANGDQRAFAALYDRYFPQIYDLAVRMLRDPEAAADVVQSTFAEASSALHAGRTPEHVRAWIYSIAMGEAIARAQQAAASAPAPIDDQRLPSFIETDSTRRGGQLAGESAGLRKAVWESAAQLSPREYGLLDMSVRRELGNDEMAEGLGISEETAASTVSGVRHNFEQAAATEILTHRGREACPDLDALLQRAAPAGAGPENDAVGAHLAGCERCQATLASYPSAVDVLSGLALVPAPAGMKEVIWGSVVAPAATAPPPPIVSPAEEEGKRRRWWLWALLAGLALLGIVVALFILLSGGDDNAAVSDPDDIRSTNHEIGKPSTDDTIDMVWSRQSGVRAYSVDWTNNEFDLPDEQADLDGTANGTTSPPLDPGTWYFHLRTQSEDGTWTSTSHIGPYEIVAATPSPSPQATQKPTAVPTAQPTAPPTAAPTAPPTATPKPATPTPTP